MEDKKYEVDLKKLKEVKDALKGYDELINSLYRVQAFHQDRYNQRCGQLP